MDDYSPVKWIIESYDPAYYRDEVKCFVTFCKKKRRDFPNITFLTVPKSLKAIWCQTLMRNCPKRVLYACEEHFNIEQDCYKKRGKLYLKDTANLSTKRTKTYHRKMPLTAAEKQKRYRERMQEICPQKFEEAKKKNAARNRKRKKINECTEYEKEMLRKQWRQRKNAQKKNNLKAPQQQKVPRQSRQPRQSQQPRQSLASQPGPSAGSSTSLRARDDEEQNYSSAYTQSGPRLKTLMPTKVYSYTRRRQNAENIEEPNAAPLQFGTSKKRKIGSNASYKTEPQDPLSTEPVDTDSKRCRICAKIAEDCIDATDKPYLEKNKTALALNSLSVELDFDIDAPKVCLDCDRKLQEIFDFVLLVRAAQDSLIEVDEDMKDEIKTVKTEFSSPIPEDDDEIEDEDTKEGLIESVTIGETVFVKDNIVIHKNECDKTETPKRKKELQVEKDQEVTSENSVLIVDIKEEAAQMDDDAYNVHKTAYSVVSDTGTDDKPSELDATYALPNETADETNS